MGVWRRPSLGVAESAETPSDADTGGVAESAETPYGDSSRGFWRVTGRGTVRQSVLASLRSSAAGGNP